MPQAVFDFHLISCANIIYKIIAKTLANHLAVAPGIVALNQIAYVKGKRIADNYGVAQKNAQGRRLGVLSYCDEFHEVSCKFRDGLCH